MDIKCNESECHLVPPSPPSDLIPFDFNTERAVSNVSKPHKIKKTKSKVSKAKGIKVPAKRKKIVSHKKKTVAKGRVSKSLSRKTSKSKASSWIKKAGGKKQTRKK